MGDNHPKKFRVLLAKVKVILKRFGDNKEVKLEQAKTEVAGITLLEDKFCVGIKGKEVALKSKEFALFKCLFEHRNSIVTKEALFEKVWGDSFYSDGTLNVHIRKLREKLEENPNDPTMIKTIWGTGYMLELQ